MTRERWRLVWGLWLIAIVLIAAGTFGLIEYLAWDAGGTLSWTVATLPAYGIAALAFLVGALVAGLGVHFFWHFMPDQESPKPATARSRTRKSRRGSAR